MRECGVSGEEEIDANERLDLGDLRDDVSNRVADDLIGEAIEHASGDRFDLLVGNDDGLRRRGGLSRAAGHSPDRWRAPDVGVSAILGLDRAP